VLTGGSCVSIYTDTPHLFSLFIERNIQEAKKGGEHFRAFVEHFQSVVAYFKDKN